MKPGRVSSELTLDVSLRRVTDRGGVSDEFRTVSTGIGQIPSLHVGQRWRDGQLVGVATFDTFSRVVQLDRDCWRIVDASENVTDANTGERKFLIPPYEYRLPPRMMSSRCIAFTIDGVADALIIPCIEVARAWYFRSTTLSLRLTSAPYAEARRQLYNDAYPPTREDGTPQVVLRTGLSHLDAATVSMLIHDASAQEGVTRIMDSVARASAMGRDAFIEALPPVVGRRGIKVRGRRYRSQGEERFLAGYFEEVPYPLIGAQLEWDLDNTSQNKGGDAEITRSAWPRIRPPADVTPQHKLHHDREPRTDSAPVNEGALLPSFAGLPLLKRLPPRQQSTQSASGRPIADPALSNELSTGVGESTLEGPGQLRIQDIFVPTLEVAVREVFPAGFSSMLEVVAEIDARAGLRCRVVIGSNRTSGPLVTPCSHFPNYNPKPRGRWQLLGGRPRQFLAIEVETPVGVAYAIEIERRIAGMGGRSNPESFALGLLAAREGRSLTLGEFDVIAKNCIEEQGVWPPMIGGAIRVRRLRHAYASCVAFADAIVATVWDLLRMDRVDTADSESQRQDKRRSNVAD